MPTSETIQKIVIRLHALLLLVMLTGMALGLDTKARTFDGPSEPKQPTDDLANAPGAARAWKNPYQGQADAIAAGRKLYRQHCASCHGEDGRGQGKAPNLRSAAIQQAPPGVLFWFLKNGNMREGMPSWSGLPDQRRWQLVTYLKTLR